MIRPIRNTVLARHEIGEPAGQAGDRENAGRHREPAEHLHHAELDAHVRCPAASLPAASVRDTTSVDIASATTSCTTVPITISMAPST